MWHGTVEMRCTGWLSEVDVRTWLVRVTVWVVWRMRGVIGGSFLKRVEEGENAIFVGWWFGVGGIGAVVENG